MKSNIYMYNFMNIIVNIYIYIASFSFENSNMLPHRSIIFQICLAWNMLSMRNEQQIKKIRKKEMNSIDQC